MTLASFFTWSGWNFFVAVGTLALAAGTGWLAWESREQIKFSRRELDAVETQTSALVEQTGAVRDQVAATEEQVRISSAALEASSRPVLVGIAPTVSTSGMRELIPYTPGFVPDVEVERGHYHETDGMVFCSLPLRNVGTGVAFIKDVQLRTIGSSYPGRISQPVVEPGALTRARFAVTVRGADDQATDANSITRAGHGFAEFTLCVVYSAASSELVTSSEVTAAELPDRALLVTRNEIYDGEGDGRRLLTASENLG